jgi:hypothetical protein
MHRSFKALPARVAITLGVLFILAGCGGAPGTATGTAVVPTAPVAVVPSATALPTATATPLPSIEVGEPVVGGSESVEPGDQIPISIPVEGPAGVKIDYVWTAPEGKGKIIAGDGTPAITYEAPTEPGTYQLRVKVTAAGRDIERSVSIKVEEPTPTPTPTAPPTPTAIPCQLISIRPRISQPATDLEAEFLTPQHCSTNLPAGASFPVGGTYSGNLEGREIWILVYPSNLQYYPQSPNACDQLPSNASEGQWGTSIGFGGPPQQYDIVVTVTSTNSEASRVFKNWLREGCVPRNFPGFSTLPAGLIELTAITVHTQEQ